MTMIFRMVCHLPLAAGLLLACLFAAAQTPAFAQPKKPASNPKKLAEPPPAVAERTITIAKVKPEARAAALASAARIDALVEANYAKHKVTPNPILSDELFARRVYLD